MLLSTQEQKLIDAYRASSDAFKHYLFELVMECCEKTVQASDMRGGIEQAILINALPSSVDCL